MFTRGTNVFPYVSHCNIYYRDSNILNIPIYTTINRQLQCKLYVFSSFVGTGTITKLYAEIEMWKIPHAADKIPQRNIRERRVWSCVPGKVWLIHQGWGTLHWRKLTSPTACLSLNEKQHSWNYVLRQMVSFCRILRRTDRLSDKVHELCMVDGDTLIYFAISKNKHKL